MGLGVVRAGNWWKPVGQTGEARPVAATAGEMPFLSVLAGGLHLEPRPPGFLSAFPQPVFVQPRTYRKQAHHGPSEPQATLGVCLENHRVTVSTSNVCKEQRTRVAWRKNQTQNYVPKASWGRVGGARGERRARMGQREQNRQTDR